MPLGSLAIIEDNDKIREYLWELLSTAYPETDVIVYANSEDALNVLKNEPVDMVLFDIELPGV